MRAFLHGFGMHVPERVVTNAEMAARVERTAEWIEGASGIRERRWAAAETSVADLAIAAAHDCLARAGVAASSLGLIIVASGSAGRDFRDPRRKWLRDWDSKARRRSMCRWRARAVLFGMAMAAQMAAHFGDVLVIGAEKMSAVIEAGPLDPNTAILFGDGAGAVLVSARPGRWEILDAVLHSDGQYRDSLAFDWSAPLRMNGLSVILQAARKLPSSIEEVLTRQKVAAADVAAFLLHQANQNLLMRVAKSLGVPAERVFSNVARYGNTSSASMLIAAAEWSQANPAAGPVVFSAFGAGFHWGALLARERLVFGGLCAPLGSARLRHQVGRAQQRFEGAGVGPPAVDERVGHGAFANVGVVDVGDFEFTAAAGHQLLDLFEHGAVVHVDAGDGVIRLGLLRLLFDADDAAAHPSRPRRSARRRGLP